MESEKKYLPAAGLHILLPLYDLIAKWMGMDRPRARLVQLSELQPGQKALDVGCGTGTLAVMIKSAQPGLEMAGMDPDGKALALAERKAFRAGLSVQFDRGFAGELPYADQSFEHVFSSFMFHHLPAADKSAMLKEVARVLRQGGQFHLADFNGQGHGFLARIAHSHEVLRENSEEHVLALMNASGLKNARVVARDQVIFGGIGFYEATR